MFDALLSFDQPVSTFLQHWAAAAPGFWKVISIYGVYTAPILLLWVWFGRRQRERSLTAALAGIVSWQILNNLVQLAVGVRERPLPIELLDYPTREFLFDVPGPSFPSDHAAFFVALAITFWRTGERTAAWVVGSVGALTLLARVVTAQHWPTDILGGAVIGIITAWLFAAFDQLIQRWIVRPVVGLAKRIGL